MSTLPPITKEIVILVVDDEVIVRNVVQRVLSNEGFSVLVAAGGQEALEIFQVYPDLIKMLLTDIEMPGTNGYQVAEQIRIIKPAMKIMFMSGKLADSQTAPPNFLSKPFQPRTLVVRVRETLSDLITADIPPVDSPGDTKLTS